MSKTASGWLACAQMLQCMTAYFCCRAQVTDEQVEAVCGDDESDLKFTCQLAEHICESNVEVFVVSV